MEKVKFAIPAGSLSKATFEILQRSGYKISGQERTYRPTINDPKIELKILRPQEIPVFVSEGLQDVAITGQDWIRETRTDVEVLQNLEYGKIRLVVAVPKSFETKSISDFMESLWSKGKNFRVSTEYLNIASEYIKNKPAYRKRFGDSEPLIVTPWWRKGDNSRAKIFLSFGATEAKPGKRRLHNRCHRNGFHHRSEQPENHRHRDAVLSCAHSKQESIGRTREEGENTGHPNPAQGRRGRFQTNPHIRKREKSELEETAHGTAGIEESDDCASG